MNKNEKMKKYLMGLIMLLMTAVFFAQVPQINYAAAPGVEIVNDSTLIYYDTYKIVINQPDDVCTEIYRAPSLYEARKGKDSVLMEKHYGSFVFKSPYGNANYIVCASKPFSKTLFKQTQTVE